VRLFSPWDLDVSPRMRRHLLAAGVEVPTGADCPTGDELVARVLEPAGRLSAIASCLALGTRVLQVTRRGLLKNDEIGTAARGAGPFRILVRDREGVERIDEAEIVLDCTGSRGHPNPIGDGGIPAPGESAAAGRIVHDIPDTDGDPEAWAGKTILLLGAGHSAETAARDLARLASSRPGTTIYWALRSAEPSFAPIPDDPLPARSALMAEAGELARGASPHLQPIPGAAVDSLRPAGGRVAVDLRLADGEVRTVEVDRIVAMTGSVGDASIYRQLQVHECWATSGPMKLAASLLANASDDCLADSGAGPETLVNPEPDFFILGAKSYGRNSTFLMRVGWQQVDDVCGLIGARAA
jgi:thioredoxin reductase